jgi:hypothetical protein
MSCAYTLVIYMVYTWMQAAVGSFQRVWIFFKLETELHMRLCTDIYLFLSDNFNDVRKKIEWSRKIVRHFSKPMRTTLA